MNNIKISVAYEVPPTTKFDALMKEYEVAKKVADEIIMHYKPLADTAEETKILAILEQLKTIQEYAKQLAKLKNALVQLKAYGNSNRQPFIVSAYSDGSTCITWCGAAFNYATYKHNPTMFVWSDYNILGNWNKWNVYQQLEEAACYRLQAYIEATQNTGEIQIARLKNITQD